MGRPRIKQYPFTSSIASSHAWTKANAEKKLSAINYDRIRQLIRDKTNKYARVPQYHGGSAAWRIYMRERVEDYAYQRLRNKVRSYRFYMNRSQRLLFVLQYWVAGFMWRSPDVHPIFRSRVRDLTLACPKTGLESLKVSRVFMRSWRRRTHKEGTSPLAFYGNRLSLKRYVALINVSQEERASNYAVSRRIDAIRNKNAVAVANISHAGDHKPPVAVLPSYTDAVAYAATQGPLDYTQMAHIMKEVAKRIPRFRPETMLCVGAGTGASIWGVQSVYGPQEYHHLFAQQSPGEIVDHRPLDSCLRHIHAIEPSDGMRKVLRDVTVGMPIHISEDYTVPTDRRYDIVMSHGLLGDLLSDAQRRTYVKKMWAATGGILVLAEWGTELGFKWIAAARDAILANRSKCSDRVEAARIRIGGYMESDKISPEIGDLPEIVAPCPHMAGCPLAGTQKACRFFMKHESDQLQRSIDVDDQFQKNTFTKYMQPVSYVVFMRSSLRSMVHGDVVAELRSSKLPEPTPSELGQQDVYSFKDYKLRDIREVERDVVEDVMHIERLIYRDVPNMGRILGKKHKPGGVDLAVCTPLGHALSLPIRKEEHSMSGMYRLAKITAVRSLFPLGGISQKTWAAARPVASTPDFNRELDPSLWQFERPIEQEDENPDPDSEIS